MGYEWKLNVQYLGSILIRVDSIFSSFFPSCWVKQTVIVGVLAAIWIMSNLGDGRYSQWSKTRKKRPNNVESSANSEEPTSLTRIRNKLLSSLSHEWFSLHVAGTKVHKEIWPPSSLSFLLPQALSSAPFSVPWCDWWVIKWPGFQRRESFLSGLQPKPQTSSLGFLAHCVVAHGTLPAFATILWNFTGKGSCEM